YDSWTLMIAVPKTPQMERLLRPFHDLDDGEFMRLDVHTYPKRLAIDIFCEFEYDGPLWSSHEDTFEELVELLAELRAEILQGNVSFLQAVADFYMTDAEDEEDSEEGTGAPPRWEPPAEWTKPQLQQECTQRGIAFRKSWNKDQLREALAAAAVPLAPVSRTLARSTRGGKPPKLSR